VLVRCARRTLREGGHGGHSRSVPKHEIAAEPHLVDFGKNDQQTPEFLSLNPNGKIPCARRPLGCVGRDEKTWLQVEQEN
jgi:glutathione S-transferase